MKDSLAVNIEENITTTKVGKPYVGKFFCNEEWQA